jgi:hypothetical protein
MPQEKMFTAISSSSSYSRRKTTISRFSCLLVGGVILPILRNLQVPMREDQSLQKLRLDYFLIWGWMVSTTTSQTILIGGADDMASF